MKIFSRIVLAFIACLVVPHAAGAQTIEDLPNLKELKGKALGEKIEPMQNKKGMWGYANSEGKFIIKPVFHEALPYEGKIARICYEGKWGTINDRGLYVIIPFLFDDIAAFSSDSLAVVNKGGRYSLVNARGQLVQNVFYDEIDYADYGYRLSQSGKYGTLSRDGKTIFEPQFDEISMLDREHGVEMIRKDGKWGLLKDGRDILTIQWEAPLTLLQKGGEGQLDMYLAFQGGKYGVVNTYGKFVAPCVYDEIDMSMNGMYYVTRQGDRYGALSMKMDELIPPVLENRPYLSEDVFRLHVDGEFFAVSYKGAVPFKDCADLYQVFRPEDYVTTRQIPEWSKNAIIEDNLNARLDEIDAARGSNTVIPASDISKYGILPNAVFAKSSGTVTDYEDGFHNVSYKAKGMEENDFYFVTNPSTGEIFLNMAGELFSLKQAVSDFNIKKFTSFYPKGYVRLSDDEILVQFAFIRPAKEVSESIVETMDFMLPVEPFTLNIHKGEPVPASETHAAFVFDLDSLKAVSCMELPAAGGCRLLVSEFGGMYMFPDAGTKGTEKPLTRLDRNGVVDWTYMPYSTDRIYDIEETENFIYLCGAAEEQGSVFPLVIQLSKAGKMIRRKTVPVADSWFGGLKCRDHLLYAQTSSKKSAAENADYAPYFLLDDWGDDFGVHLNCVWEDWGGKMMGGCGLMSHNGKWLSTLMLNKDEQHSAFGWEFGAFTSDHLIVRHMDRAGLVDKEGSIVIEPKYDNIEYMSNPSYLKVFNDDRYGVVDVNGRIIVPVEYDYVGDMSEDIIIVRKQGMYGCFDRNGRMIVPMDYEEIREYVGGMARIRVKDRFGFIDTKGEVVVAPFSDEVENFSEGCALVTIKGKFGLVTIAGDWVVVPMYDDGSSFSGGLAYLSHKGKYGYVDKTGEFVIPMQFVKATDFNTAYNMACVASDKGWGVIDNNGTVVVPLEYDTVAITDDGYICVSKAGKFGILSRDGKKIIDTVLDSVDISSGNVFRYGAAAGRVGEQRVRVDRQGNIVYGIWVNS